MNIRLATIGDYVEPIATWNPASRPHENFTYVDLSSVSQSEKSIVSSTSMLGSEAPSRARQPVKAGDVLVSTVRPNLNGVARVTNEFDGAIASTGFCVLRPRTERLDSGYLMHWVRAPQFIESMVRQATGASYPAVSDRIVKGSLIPLPPLDAQRRIAAILDKADALRRKRKRAIQSLDSLTQSIFLEMFGDPVQNPKVYPMRQLSEIAETRLGKMLDAAKQTRLRRYKYLANTNVQWGHFELTELREMGLSDEDRLEFSLKDGDLLICEGGEIGRCAIWRNEIPECYFQKALHRLRCKRELVIPEYMEFFFRLMAQNGGLSPFTTAATIPHLTGIKLRALRVPLPPMTTQIEFARAHQSIFRQRMLLQSHCRHLTAMFSSLQSRAFSSEL